MNRLGQDLRFALRWLLKHPAFAFATIATLALGIAAVTTIYSVVHAVLLAPLPYPSPSELVMVWQTDPSDDSMREAASYPDLLDFRESASSFTGLAGFSSRSVNIGTSEDHPERISAAAITTNLTTVLGTPPIAGRAMVEEDDGQGAPRVALISERLWESRFQRQENALGSSILIDGNPVTIIGVLPGEFDFPGPEVDVWLPFESVIGEFREMRGVHGTAVIGRLSPGRTIESAQAEMDAISRRLEEAYADNEGRGAFVEPLHEAIVRESRAPLTILLTAVAILLLIACANVGGLMLAKGMERSSELAVRGQLGASRWQIIAQLLTESLLIAMLGCAGGVALSWVSLAAISKLVPEGFPRMYDVSLSVPVITISVLVSLLTAVLVGILPALHSSGVRQSDGTSRGSSARRHLPRAALVVVETALAVFLLVGAVLVGRSLWELMNVELGFNPDGVLAVDLALPAGSYPVPDRATYPNWPEVFGFQSAVLERIRAIPGVGEVAIAHQHPLASGWTSEVTVAGASPVEGPAEETRLRPITERYFETIGARLLAGRTILASDTLATSDVVVVNQAFVDRYLQGEDPLSKSVLFWGKERKIVGVVSNIRFRGLGEGFEPAIYPSSHQLPMGNFTVLVRAGGSPEQISAAVREAIWSVDPNLALFNIETLDQKLANASTSPRFRTILMVLFGVVALLLSSIGLYALISFQVEHSRREIGIRLAIGADRSQVTAMILRRGMVLSAGGVVIGLLLAAATRDWLSSILFEIPAADLASYAGVAAAVFGAAIVASLLPARRAAATDPAITLRFE